MNKEFAKLGAEQRNQLLQMHRGMKHVQGTGRSIQKQEDTGLRRVTGLAYEEARMPGESLGFSFVSQGWLVWISHLTMLKSI